MMQTKLIVAAFALLATLVIMSEAGGNCFGPKCANPYWKKDVQDDTLVGDDEDDMNDLREREFIEQQEERDALRRLLVKLLLPEDDDRDKRNAFSKSRSAQDKRRNLMGHNRIVTLKKSADE
uniref:Uncharacterized protein LOC100373122 n=1 Tax=Saccoglossus kowalevskii TaxID=10224 RepID=A0ABM0GST9_SACKO|nr:PREDICTED: uncharacterized protein LOC100373122 [Saccoglossus kowalevskii]